MNIIKLTTQIDKKKKSLQAAQINKPAAHAAGADPSR